MKKLLLYLMLLLGVFTANAQTCEELLEYVKSEYYGSSYSSYNSDAISKVTFYEALINYQYHYFAIVCFKRKYAYSCDEYIYQVGSNTKLNYSMHYLSSAGEAFWKYIQPYNENLGCAPAFN
jgi:hypothetical protein